MIIPIKVFLRNTIGIQKNKQKALCKNFIEIVFSIHERIRKSTTLGANKQV